MHILCGKQWIYSIVCCVAPKEPLRGTLVRLDLYSTYSGVTLCSLGDSGYFETNQVSNLPASKESFGLAGRGHEVYTKNTKKK